jgi:tRNA(Ile2) C34 agmatinyltransferase TiaS
MRLVKCTYCSDLRAPLSLPFILRYENARCGICGLVYISSGKNDYRHQEPSSASQKQDVLECDSDLGQED